MSFKTGSCQSCHSTFSRYLSFIEWHDFFVKIWMVMFLHWICFWQFEESTITSILIFFSISQKWYLTGYCRVINQYPYVHENVYLLHNNRTGGTKNAPSFFTMCSVPSPPNSQNLSPALHKKTLIYYYVQCTPPNSQTLSTALHKRPK